MDIDLQASLLLVRFVPHTTYLDIFFSFLSITGLTVYIWIIILAVYFFWEEEKHKEFIIYFLAAFIPTTFLVNYVLKVIFGRVRPWIELGIRTTHCPSDFSFPSGHASGAFAGAVIFTHFDKKRGWLYYSIATLISYSRIYLYCHYLSDVVVGALIGCAIAFFTIKIVAQWKLYSPIARGKRRT